MLEVDGGRTTDHQKWERETENSVAAQVLRFEYGCVTDSNQKHLANLSKT
jgi:hypothetical protein